MPQNYMPYQNEQPEMDDGDENFVSYYKTQICQNWLETSQCRFGNECTFAHGPYELNGKAAERLRGVFKTRNCREFHHGKICMKGHDCFFRHANRTFKQNHRHYYTP